MNIFKKSKHVTVSLKSLKIQVQIINLRESQLELELLTCFLSEM